MKNVYQNTSLLDKRACEKFSLTPELLMENAASALESLIAKITHKGSVITILCGGGDNGGDGYALARRLSGEYSIRIYQVKEPKSPLCVKNYERAKLCEVKFIKKILPCDVVVDCIVGSGLKGELTREIIEILQVAQKNACLCVACDVPSGLSESSTLASHNIAFKAHHTLCMGAINLACLSDVAKDFVGQIHIGNLGISQNLYQISSNIKMLESSDLKLPHRKIQNTHKGDFGHLGVFAGEKLGACILSAQAALHFGVGLVSVIEKQNPHTDSIPFTLMQSPDVPQNATALALGMGLGVENSKLVLESLIDSTSNAFTLPCVLDADVFHTPKIKDFLDTTLSQQTLDFSREIVLTPHPKEFNALLQHCGLGEYNPSKRIQAMLDFTQKYPHTTLLLKGANVFIAKSEKIYINPLGSNALAKGGSGDVLSGLIAALLAQGYNGLDSALQGTLAHSIAAQKCLKHIADFGLTPNHLLQAISTLR
ncbi:NAD(P)H-hydrate dehydratase [Helicobacter cinaedi]|uniref:NAD(P)H-hydrate dehydratase n=1 Tax=Helicobacter cinaedi TaxID=213 RepID=UPI000CF17293|nr:NAD(P)H-hydrate dehydratase [Helicobacter cinaedi]AWK61777.1 NAD(P)H-hydrate dehydratase [Helicobacter cinaedi]QOQ95876.1 NAD(P)H-hydrate dehydratase [Helicobacter cinaedi]